METYVEKGWVVVVLPKKFGISQASVFSSFCGKHMQEGQFKVIVDARQLEWIDSFSAGILMKKRGDLRNLGGDLRVRKLKGQPLEYFEQTSLTHVFE